MRELRRRLGMDRLQLARMIGYTGTDRNNEMRVKRLENNGPGSPVPLYIARLLWLIELYWQDHDADLPDFPEWPGYEFDHTPDPHHQKGETNDVGGT
jgi:hypothetical protein